MLKAKSLQFITDGPLQNPETPAMDFAIDKMEAKQELEDLGYSDGAEG